MLQSIQAPKSNACIKRTNTKVILHTFLLYRQKILVSYVLFHRTNAGLIHYILFLKSSCRYPFCCPHKNFGKSMSQLLKRMHPLLCMYPIQVLPAAQTNGKKAFGKAYLIAFRKAHLTAFGKDKSFAIYSFTRLIYFVNSLQGLYEPLNSICISFL